MKAINWIKCGLIFLSGAAAGASLAWGYLHKKLEKQYDEAASEEIEAITKSIEDRYRLRKEREEKAVLNSVEETIGTPEPDPPITDISDSPNLEPKSSIVKVEKPSKTDYTVPDFADPEGEHPMDDDEPHGAGPYLISEEEHDTKLPRYDMVRLWYNNMTEEFVDEHGNYLDDPDAALGYDNIRYLIDVNKEEVWIRNDGLDTDFYVLYEDEPL